MSGMQTNLHVKDGRMVIENVQDCDPILDDVKARHNQGFHGTSEMKHAARLPLVAVQSYMNTNGIDFQEFMSNPAHIKRMCNDPELSKFRIWPGKV